MIYKFKKQLDVTELLLVAYIVRTEHEAIAMKHYTDAQNYWVNTIYLQHYIALINDSSCTMHLLS